MPLTEPTRLVLAKTYVGVDDPDAAAYIAAVEAADEAASPGVGALETATKVAIHSFVKGCKADGIWSAIKASCILAGARTLSGALVPLRGTAPTNINFSGAEDSSWNSVSLLLRGEGPDNSTTFTDSSPSPLTPTVNASSVLDILASAGKFGSGIKYTNTGITNAYILYNNPTALQFGTGDFTWECWIRPDQAPAAGFHNVLWDSRASGDALTNRLYVDFYPGGGSTLRCFANGTLIQSTTNLSVGAWYHVAICKASGTTRLFVNGVEEASTSDSANYTNGTNRPILFNNLFVNQRGVNFSFDELRVTKGVARYTSNFTPPTLAFPGSLQSDYSRTTGLVGDGSTKYLGSNRLHNQDPLNNAHCSVYPTSLGATSAFMGCALNGGSRTVIQNNNRMSCQTSLETVGAVSSAVGFMGVRRNDSSNEIHRSDGVSATVTISSVSLSSLEFTVFARRTGTGTDSFSSGRLSFYSIGESLDLALLDARVTDLINAFGAAIP